MYLRIIEKPYKVYVGVAEYVDNSRDEVVKTGVDYSYHRSYDSLYQAEIYANILAERYEFVKIEKAEEGK